MSYSKIISIETSRSYNTNLLDSCWLSPTTQDVVLKSLRKGVLSESFIPPTAGAALALGSSAMCVTSFHIHKKSPYLRYLVVVIFDIFVMWRVRSCAMLLFLFRVSIGHQ